MRLIDLLKAVDNVAVISKTLVRLKGHAGSTAAVVHSGGKVERNGHSLLLVLGHGSRSVSYACSRTLLSNDVLDLVCLYLVNVCTITLEDFVSSSLPLVEIAAPVSFCGFSSL